MQRNVIVLFLASPSDVEDERRCVKETVERINRIFGKNSGWQFELRGWEDALPDFRRPQDVINKDVDECELFIGMLWSRWGTPTASYTSGFHEEFERVSRRWQETKVPNIWLLFRKLDSERLQDPGPQLAQVLAFKAEQSRINKLFYKEYEDVERFKELIYDHLVEYLLVKSREASEPESEANRPAETITQGNAPSVIQEPGNAEERRSLAMLLQQVIGSLETGVGEIDLPLAARTRLLLATTSWFSARHADETFGTHELNIAYLYRNDWRLTSPERLLLVRSMLADKYAYSPGWYWLAQQQYERISLFLNYFALSDGRVSVRVGAIRFATQLHISFEAEDLTALLADSEEEVSLAAVQWLKTNGTVAHIPLLRGSLSDGRSAVRDAAGAVYFTLQFAVEPATAVKEYVELGAKPANWLGKQDINAIVGAHEDFFKQLLSRSEGSVRAFAVEWLRRNNALDLSAWEQLLSDPEPRVKATAVDALIDGGRTFDRAALDSIFVDPSTPGARSLFSLALFGADKDALSRRQLERELDAKLYARLDFFDIDGPVIYEVLATRHAPVIMRRIRNDFQSKFETLKAESETKLRAVLGEAADAILARWAPAAIAHLRDEFVVVALKHMSHLATSGDREVVRQFLHSPNAKVAGAAGILLGAIGDVSDVDDLREMLPNLRGRVREDVIEAAISLASNKEELLSALVNDENAASYIQAVARHVFQLAPELRIRIASAMLQSTDDEVRLYGVRVLALTMTIADLSSTLNAYISQETYYYDVVSRLDQLIYAPEPYRQIYVEAMTLSGAI